MLKAKYHPRSGLRDYDLPVQNVIIVGFLYGEYDHGYQAHGNKRCTLAVIVDENGHISQAELNDLIVDNPNT